MEHPLRKYRRENNVSLETLAGKSGVSTSTLSRIENGLRTPNIDDLTKILHAIDNALEAEDFAGRRVEQAS